MCAGKNKMGQEDEKKEDGKQERRGNQYDDINVGDDDNGTVKCEMIDNGRWPFGGALAAWSPSWNIHLDTTKLTDVSTVFFYQRQSNNM